MVLYDMFIMRISFYYTPVRWIIAWFCLLFFAIPIHAQNSKYVVEHLGVRDGLSKNEVTSIIRDHDGFLWFGTRGGLNRYDGYEFVEFQPEPGLKNTLHNPSVERIYEDSRGYLWIGTKSGGLSRMDLETRSITGINSSKTTWSSD